MLFFFLACFFHCLTKTMPVRLRLSSTPLSRFFSFCVPFLFVSWSGNELGLFPFRLLYLWILVFLSMCICSLLLNF